MAAQKINKRTLKVETEVRREPVQTTVREEPEKEVVAWVAPSRPFKKKDREFWMTLVGIAAIAGLVLFLVEGVMPVLLIVSLIFFLYVTSTVEPDSIRFSVTTKGVRIVDRLTEWSGIMRFWFEPRLDSELVVCQINSFPGRLELVIDRNAKEKIRKALSQYVSEEDYKPTGIEKVIGWFTNKIPSLR